MKYTRNMIVQSKKKFIATYEVLSRFKQIKELLQNHFDDLNGRTLSFVGAE